MHPRIARPAPMPQATGNAWDPQAKAGVCTSTGNGTGSLDDTARNDAFRITPTTATWHGLNTGNPAILVGRSSGLDLFGFSLAAAVDFASSVGPVSGTGVAARNQFRDVPTSRGQFSFNSSGSVPFTGVAGDGALPEPATWALLIAVFGLVGAAARRRRLARA